MIHGNRRIPADTIRARMFTKAGDVYDQAALERDFNSLWNTGYFDDLRIEREPSAKGWIIHVYVKEKPTIREIKYIGLSSVSQSDVLDKFKEQKVGLTQESQYDPTKVKHAEVVIKELLAAHGHQFATVRSEVRPIPPAAVALTFVVKEGPKVKVGKIKFEGNKAIKSARTAQRDEEPEAHRHSALHLPGEPVRAHLRLHQAERRRRTRPLLLPDQGLLQGAGRRSQDADPRHQRRHVVFAVQVVPRQSRRHHHAGGRRRSATG